MNHIAMKILLHDRYIRVFSVHTQNDLHNNIIIIAYQTVYNVFDIFQMMSY